MSIENYTPMAPLNQFKKLTNKDVNTDASDLEGAGVNLAYPSDIFKEPVQYANCYTAFFITIQQGSSLISGDAGKNLVQEKSEVFTDNRLGSRLEKNITDTLTNKGKRKIKDGEESVKGAVGTTLGLVAAYKAGKAISEKSENIVASGIAGAAAFKLTDKVVQSVLDVKPAHQVQKACIVLPTPAIRSNYNFSWDQTNMDIFGGIVEAGEKLNNADGFMKSIGTIFSGNGKTAEDSLAKSAAQAMLFNTPMVGKQMSALARKAANPRKEQLFNETQLRSFTFEYTFAPTSEQEARDVEAIIRQFKYHAHPEFTTDRFTMIYPSEFDIVHFYKNEENPHLPKHTTSILKSVSVDYSGGSSNFGFFRNGMPTIINLSLNFEELTALDKSAIAEGY